MIPWNAINSRFPPLKIVDYLVPGGRGDGTKSLFALIQVETYASFRCPIQDIPNALYGTVAFLFLFGNNCPNID
jgi:hypothetical protein